MKNFNTTEWRKYIPVIKAILDKFLKPGTYKAFIFGSRALGTHEKYSDIDLGLYTNSGKPIPGHIREYIREALEESDIPYRVDVVDFTEVSEDFKQEALQRIIEL